MTDTTPFDFAGGDVRPTGDRGCTPEQVATLLRDRGLIGAVGRAPQDALSTAAGITEDRLPVQLCLAVTADRRVLTSAAAGPVPGPTLADVVETLAGATGCDVDIAEEFAAGVVEPGPDDEDPAGIEWVDMPDDTLPDVVICRSPLDVLPLLARDVSAPLRATRIGEHLVVQFGPGAQLHEHGWLAAEGPVIALSGFGGDRYVSVLVGRGTLPGQATLARAVELTPVFAPDEAAPATAPIIDLLGAPHRQPDSQLSLLRAEAPFAHLDPHAVSAALQSEAPGWYARVLMAIGMPAEVAAVAAAAIEDGTLPDDAIEIEPLGFWAALRETVRRFDQDALDDTRRRGPLRRLHARGLRKPLALLATIIPELAIGVPALVWVWTADPRPWWMVVIGVVAALLIVDAVVDIVVMIRRLTRRAATR